MSEEEARDRVKALVDEVGFARLERMVSLVIAANEGQNLIARSTVNVIWSRHVLDSVQLLRWAKPESGAWLDIGTGGGFPGLAIAAAQDGDTLLVEPRRLRSTFLGETADALGLTRTRVAAAKVETVRVKAATISARAVASTEKLLHSARHCATPTTQWVLLRGQRPDEGERIALERAGAMFHVEQSLTSPSSVVLVARRIAK